MTTFMTWVGNKAKYVPAIEPYLPKEFYMYWEPFLGSGALYLSRINGPAMLSDSNPELVNLWQMVQRDYKPVLEGLQSLLATHSKDQYYEIRAATPTDTLDRAVRMVYLIHTCFNGLWRVNKQGQYNVPMGDQPKKAKPEAFRRAHEKLKLAVVMERDYSVIDPKPGDLVYLDPPYLKNFSSYTNDGFGLKDHEHLARVASMWYNMGVNVVVSNSIKSLYLYKEFKAVEMYRNGNINSDGKKRGKVKELLLVGVH